MFTFGQVILYIFLFALGAAIGSFLNVCIYRLPHGGSLVKPAHSYCPICHEPIAWYDNIPLVSYFALGRRCRQCGSLISARYFLVELLTAFGIIFLFWMFSRRGETAGVTTVYVGLFCMLVVSSFIDIELHIIPDELTIGGMLLVPLCCLVVPELHYMPECGRDSLFIFGPEHVRLGSLFACFLGMAVGAAVLYATGVLGKLLFRKEALGMGDVKLMAAIGGLLGWKMVLLAFIVGTIVGAIIGVIALLKTRDHHIAYGPFLSIGAIVVMVSGNAILDFLTLLLAPV